MMPPSAPAGKSKMTLEERAALKASGIFDERPGSLCSDCGGYHLRKACPRIRREVFVGQGAAAGVRTEVEYWQDGHWDNSEIIFPEDVFDLESGEE